MSKRILIYLCFVSFFSIATIASDIDLNNQKFSHLGTNYLISVRTCGDGFDIFLSHDNEQKNISQEFKGKNLFPRIQSQGDDFYITWVHFQEKRALGCYYDSSTGLSFRMHGEGFQFLSAPKIVFRKSRPWALIFLGNRKEPEKGKKPINDDIFAYNLTNHRLVNLTHTPENEKTFSLEEKTKSFNLQVNTLTERVVYSVRYMGLRVSQTQKIPNEKITAKTGLTVSVEATPLNYNTIAGFGDSITWGKIRMQDLQGEYHPELAFLSQIQNTCAQSYGPVTTINLGYPGDTTYEAMERLFDDFKGMQAYFCLVMLGTNDVGQNSFSATSSVENLNWICTQIRDYYGMYPIISTIPPMNQIDGGQYLQEATENLNSKIIEMAETIKIPYVDTYTAILNQSNWEAMIEDLIDNHTIGNHPSPAGHQIIANLFLPKLLELPPSTPIGLQVTQDHPFQMTLNWTPNEEFDISHYVVEFGYSPEGLNRIFQVTEPSFSFLKPLRQINVSTSVYYRIKVVDKAGLSSEFTEITKADFQ